MHPSRVFHAKEADLLTRADAIGFAHIFAATPDGPMVVHAPLSLAAPGRLHFHIARANRIADHLDGARVLASVAGPHGYISPNWYQPPGNQVPTWNYVTIEIEGVSHAIDDAALVRQLDLLAARHEPRVNPGNPWTRDKMEQAVFEKMLRGIRGFAIAVEAVGGTTKLSQNKSDLDRAGVIAELAASGSEELAAAMR